MSEPRENAPELTPTYQTLLIHALDAILKRLLENDQFGAFQALCITHKVLKKVVKDEVKDDWESFLAEKAKIKSVNGDFHRRMVNQNKALFQFFYRNNPLIYEKFMEALDKHKYLEEESRRPRTREKSMKDLELTLARAQYGRE